MRKIKAITVYTVILAILIFNTPLIAAENHATYDGVDIELLTSLDIIEPEEAKRPGTEPMTRAEFAAVVVRLRGLEDMALSFYHKLYFHDVDPEYYETGYINAAVGAGLMEYPDTGYFEPKKAVTYSQVTKSLITALGFNQMLKISKAGEMTFNLPAIEKGLFSGAASNAAGTITRKEIYKMVQNALSINILAPVSYGKETKFEVQKDKTILSEYHNIYKSKGVVEANHNTSLESKSTSAGFGELIINGDVYSANKTEYKDMLGYNVEFYHKTRNDTSDTNEIIYAKKVNNDVVSINSDDIIEFNKMQYTYFREGRREKAKINKACIIYNGVSAEGKIAKLDPDFGQVTLIDNDNNGIYDVALIDFYKDYIVQGVDYQEQYIYDVYGNTLDISEAKSVNIEFGKTKNKTTIFSISEGHTLTVAADLDNELINMVINEDKISGEVTEMRFDTGQELLINGVWYKYSFSLREAIANKIIEPFIMGDSKIFYLNVFDEITYYENNKQDFIGNYEYGVLVAGDMGNGLQNELKLKIFTTLGMFEIFEVTDKAYVDEERQQNTKAIYKKLCKDGNNDNGKVIPQLIRFKTNNMSEITHIDLVGESSDSAEGLYMSYDRIGAPLFYSSPSMAFGNKIINTIAVDSNLIVFVVPMEQGKIIEGVDEWFRVASSAYFVNQAEYSFLSYKADKKSLVEDVIIVEAAIINGKLDKTIPSEGNVNVFLQSSLILSSAGEALTKIYYSFNGNEMETTVDPSVNINKLPLADGSEYSLKKGDIFRMNIDLLGKANNIEPVYDFANDRFLSLNANGTEPVNTWRPSTTMYLDRIHAEKVSNGFIRAVYDNPAGFDIEKDEYFFISLARLYRYQGAFLYDSATNKVSRLAQNEILGYQTAGERYSKGFYWRRYADSRALILYK